MDVAADQFSFPIMLNLYDRLVVVVGAGAVGQRKLQKLLPTGARVRLVDPLLAGRPHPSAAVESIGRAFVAADLQDAELVFACTDDSAVNQQIADLAHSHKQLCCRADQPQAGDFSLPAVFRRGHLAVAVSTAGGSPGIAADIRDRLAEQVPDSWGVALEIMAAVRRKWLTDKGAGQYNQQVLRSFWIDQLTPRIEQGNLNEISDLLVETFGSGFSLQQLDVQLPEGTP